MITDPLAVFVILALIVHGSILLEARLAFARALGSALVAIVAALILANVGVLPGRSPTYQVLGGAGVNVGIALILLGVDVRSVVRAGPRMLGAFAIGAAGTVIGAIAATAALHGRLGPEAWKLAGQYTGTYIGGGVNMVAVGRALDTSADLFTAAVAADNVTTVIWMAICLGAPAVIGRWWGGERASGVPVTGPAPEHGAAQHAFTSSERPMRIADVAALGALAFGIVWLAERIALLTPAVPSVLWLTTLALIGAQCRPVREIAGGLLLGNYLLQLFLASLGAQSIVSEIVRVGAAVFLMTLVVVGVHGLLLFGAGRVLRLDLPTLLVASQANVGGPPSAMALASARGYADRLLPGVAVGLLGYAVGNYAGFGIARLVASVLGT